LSGLANEVKVNLEDARAMPHARILILNWDDGSRTRIRLDHGFGNWKWDGRITEYIDNSCGWVEQLNAINRVEKQNSLGIKNSDHHPTYIVISELSTG
jgi:hypothetical protein